ncbi:MAG TPA: inositol-3-phosphate synthase [Thermoanaerobaculia bacterium]|nr:inositol-3-phosphate synthase [Thermoanaerobaculia bacterium]
MAKLGVTIVGLGGAVSTTMIAGVELMLRGLVPRIGMLTEEADGNPLAGRLDFVPLEEIVFAGWDVKPANLYQAALEHRVLPPDQLAAVRERLECLVPWPAVFSQEFAVNLRGDHVVPVRRHREQIELIQARIRELRNRHGLDQVIMVNLASTEAYQELSDVHRSLDAFEAGLDADDPAISPAMRYLYAANRMRVPYCGFAPAPTVPALVQQAVEAGNPIAGADGKTGQTLVKTALAAMFRVRRLRVLGWYSVNFLGNNDGLVLEAPGANKTKVLSKISVLDSILGYEVENHQVHIHYYKPRGDAKEAWDNIDIQGFAGIPMQMKVNFLCQDSILAAPLVIDLIRLLEVAWRCGERGIQRQLSLFFKSPYTPCGETPVHDLFRQEQMLLDWVEAHAARAFGWPRTVRSS